ncbi:unnamed protein product [Rhizoctonia solani]|uniref:F-box domain-containing protein n=1 Tax=Rhizoctonia solani TaxID=456999 RepID=A0A8H3E3A9_9AGAM|nr:unnamed protein product [Rhizoctonia solani]
MIEELNTAGHLLSSALDRYAAICSSIHKTYFESSSPFTIPPELSHIVAQGQLVATIEQKLCAVKHTIARAHNSSLSHVPIHKLPPELMGQIFLFVPELTGPRVERHNCPEVLSQVCSRWRKISFGLPSLWSYISIPFGGEHVDANWIKRGLQLASRAHPLLLDVFFHNQSGSASHYPPSHIDSLKPFAENIAPHTRSLEFLFGSEEDFNDYHSILETCFNFCKPGVLKTLITAYYDAELGTCPGILVDDISNFPDYMIDSCQVIQMEDFDHLLEGITVLRLQSVYPFWTSRVYHGLVELRLVRLEDDTGDHTPPISEEHLRGILNASPSLKVLQFSIRIIESAISNARIAPIRLDHLEVLNTIGIERYELGTFLRWISPGSRPLRFAVGNTSEHEFSVMGVDIGPFFDRSNVTEIYAERVDCSTIFSLLDLCPHLRTLVWYALGFPLPNQLERTRFPISHPTLESLFVKGEVDDVFFPDLIGKSSTLRRVVFLDDHLEMGFIERLKATSGIPNVLHNNFDFNIDWQGSSQAAAGDDDEDGATTEWKWGSRAHAELGEKAVAEFMVDFMVERAIKDAARQLRRNAQTQGGDEEEDEDDEGVGRAQRDERAKDKAALEARAEKMRETMMRDVERSAGGHLSDAGKGVSSG